LNKKEISQNIVQEISDFYSRYKDLNDSITSINIDADKWSLKQILGHLIDSASNNHQRIVRLQINEKISFPDYNKDEWLAVVDYNAQKYSDMLSFLYNFNILLSSIIENISDNSLNNVWDFKWSESQNCITLKELIEHYLWHLKEHFNHFENRLNELKNGNYI
jgi:hypothetical protein